MPATNDADHHGQAHVCLNGFTTVMGPKRCPAFMSSEYSRSQPDWMAACTIKESHESFH